ncbi:Ca-transporting ATPase [Lentinula raphanica]|uniref:Calcium-transporting ATPase 1 n=1 Tax=Lentinula raphanica TaxID=153919 RepID=A0AA38P6S0_9AGAR|nr:Ca-transporting ATPase [Lentinula raphanica]KAJ3837133.1 Ca-transporting ATPase [Lentinula raphanica]
MSHPRFSSLGNGQGYERKRTNLTINADPPHAASSSASSFSRHLHNFSSPVGFSMAGFGSGPRTASPPASAYFPMLSADPNASLRPTPDANAHFAYSTTFRRHQAENSLASPRTFASGAQSLWSRVLATVTGQPSEEDRLENGRETPAPSRRTEGGNTASEKFAHTSVDDTINYFRSSATNGLLLSDIPHLLTEYGYNEFSVSAPEPVLLKFAKTIYESPLILLLCGSATVSAIMGNIDDAVSITVAVLIVLTVGFVQERRSEKSLEALNKLVPHHCHVVRSSQTHHILANELVPGDLVSFTTGDRIPADIRIISAVDLEIDESSLTGETEARVKDPNTCSFDNSSQGFGGGMNGANIDQPVALADRSCIAYMGTLVRNGRGTGVVIATGTSTEFGIIFSMMQDVEEKRTPLQLSMDELAQKLSMLSFGVIGVICLIGVLQRRSWLDMFTIGVSLAVAAIPEGLPIVTTVTLALGVLRMSKRKAIVKKLHSVESLGSVSVICSDKTGTLTKNEQTVTEAYAVDETIVLDPTSSKFVDGPWSPALLKMMDIGALCNNAQVTRNDDNAPVIVGQSTDVALLNILGVVGLTDTRNNFKRISERPFNSEQKYMAVSGVHLDASNGVGGREMCYMKGSIEAVLERCKYYYVNEDSTPPLDANMRGAVLGKAQAVASRGLRVIAIAYGYGSVETLTPPTGLSRSNSPAIGRSASPNMTSSNMVFVGFQAMYDPPRPGVRNSIADLQQGGVKVVMITGDAEQTALSIAGKLGLNVGPTHAHGASVDRVARIGGHGNGRTGSVTSMPSPSTYCLTGKAIDQMSEVQLRERIGNVSVFARTTPRHKMAIIKAFQSRGEVVAMTGDGVNDAPALKMADIGVSMGKSGTDVAKEAADAILVDDNFSTILSAVKEGKSIFHNIQNFLAFQLSTAAAALSLITLSTMLGFTNPLNAMQILFINILMDGPPSQSLGVDPVDPSIMSKPPRKKNAPIITRRLLYRVLFSASMIVLGTLFVYTYALSDDRMSKREQTMTFTSFVFLDLVSAVQNRGINCGLTQNKMLITTVSISAVTQLALIYVPFMQRIFQTDALSSSDLSVLLMLAATSATLHELRRGWERRTTAVGGSDDESWAGVVMNRV